MVSSDDNHDIMTLPEVAEYLQLAERTVLRMARRGEIPAAKIGHQWRFVRPLMREWLVGQMRSPALPEASRGEAAGSRLLPLVEVVRPELMSLHLEPGPKEAVLRQLVAPLYRAGFVRDTSRLFGALLDRERMMSTAVGHGVAIPHPRQIIPGLFPEAAIALGICPEGTDFEAIDDRLVHVFFLVCATREDVHLQLMARVVWLARQKVLPRLAKARSAEEVAGLIATADGKP